MRTVAEHNHAVGEEPPKVDAFPVVSHGKVQKSKAHDAGGRVPLAHSCPSHPGTLHQLAAPAQAQADALCNALSSQLMRCPPGTEAGAGAVVAGSQADLLLNLLAARPLQSATRQHHALTRAPAASWVVVRS